MKKVPIINRLKSSMKNSRFLLNLILMCSIIFTMSCSKSNNSSTNFSNGSKKLNHVVVIYMENHSFDNLYGSFSGANGFGGTGYNSKNSQVDASGNVYTTLPGIPANQWTGITNYSAQFPVNMPNDTFNIDQYVAANLIIPDVTHRYYQEQNQIDGGKMDKYVAYNGSTLLSMGYYKTSELPLSSLAQNYTLCDMFFHSAFGGSFLNHMWLIAAASPTFPNAPSTMVAKVTQQNGQWMITSDGQVTPDGYVVNTSYSVNTPHPANASPSTLIPNQTMPTIGDELSAANVSWAWYAGGWNNALAGKPDPTFQFHHQPFVYFQNYADGTPAKTQHLKDETDFITAAQTGNLPSVSFVKPLGVYNEHPGYANVIDGEKHAADLINAVLNGPNGKDAVIVLTYDENGGFWDHVAPPTIDAKWGPGTRVPALIISPFAKKNYVDHTQYETVSILSFIEQRWGLQPLSNRDKNATPLSNAFNF